MTTLQHLETCQCFISSAAMAPLLKLADAFQKALDGVENPLTNDAADAKGLALFRAIFSTPGSSQGSGPGFKVLEPLIIKTKLATSMVAYLERIPWETATPKMLCNRAGTPPNTTAVQHCAGLLLFFGHCPLAALEKSRDRGINVCKSFLRQVRTVVCAFQAVSHELCPIQCMYLLCTLDNAVINDCPPFFSTKSFETVSNLDARVQGSRKLIKLVSRMHRS